MPLVPAHEQKQLQHLGPADGEAGSRKRHCRGRRLARDAAVGLWRSSRPKTVAAVPNRQGSILAISDKSWRSSVGIGQLRQHKDSALGTAIL
jgi:hypothetical protein